MQLEFIMAWPSETTFRTLLIIDYQMLTNGGVPAALGFLGLLETFRRARRGHNRIHFPGRVPAFFDGGGDEGGAAFLQQVNGALGFSGGRKPVERARSPPIPGMSDAS